MCCESLVGQDECALRRPRRCNKLLRDSPLQADAFKVRSELFYPVRFYLVLSVVAASIAGLWYAGRPADRLYLPPLPMYRHLMSQALQSDRGEMPSDPRSNS